MTRLFTLTLVLAGLSACSADNGDEGLFFSRVLAPTSDCTFTAQEAEAFLSHGTYAMGAPVNYTAHVQIVSRITAATGAELQRTVQLRGARVQIAFTDGKTHGVPDQYLNFRSLTSGPVSPNGGITDTSFDIVPYQLANAVLAENPTDPVQITASIEVYGELSGDEVVSNKFVFPIVLSRGVGDISVGTCPLPAGTNVDGQSSGCSPYQEGSFTICCTNAAGNDVCPATVAEAPTM